MSAEGPLLKPSGLAAPLPGDGFGVHFLVKLACVTARMALRVRMDWVCSTSALCPTSPSPWELGAGYQEPPVDESIPAFRSKPGHLCSLPQLERSRLSHSFLYPLLNWPNISGGPRSGAAAGCPGPRALSPGARPASGARSCGQCCTLAAPLSAAPLLARSSQITASCRPDSDQGGRLSMSVGP